MRKLLNYSYLLIFIILLSAPLLQMSFSFINTPTMALDEKRELRTVKKPLLRWARMDRGLADEVNGWFDDHYGFRDYFIRANNEFSYQLFHYSNKVYIGRDNWLYEKDAYQQILNDAANTKQEQQLINKLRNLKNYFNKSGITLVLVLNPNKSSIYSEYMPFGMPKIKTPRLLQRVSKILEHEPGLIFIDGEQILAKNKNERVFYKTDIHMNPRGASYVYSEMVRRIALDAHMTPPTFSLHGWRREAWANGSEERFLAKLFRIGEKNEFTGNHIGAFKDDKNGKWEFNVGKGIATQAANFPLYDWTYINKRTEPKLLPPILVFGTSYSDGFFGLRLNELFKKVYRTKSNIPSRIIPLTKNMPSIKYFVIEYPEMLLYLIPQIPVAS